MVKQWKETSYYWWALWKRYYIWRVKGWYRQRYGYFDLICHIAYDKPPLTRKERANSVQKRDYFNKYEGKAKEILKALLEKYSDEGIETIETIEVLKLQNLALLEQQLK